MPVTRDVLEAIHQRRSSANPGSDLFATVDSTKLSPAEIAIGITPLNFSYPEGYFLRYITSWVAGQADTNSANTNALNTATAVAAYGKAPVVLPFTPIGFPLIISGTWDCTAKYTGAFSYPNNTNGGLTIKGQGKPKSIIQYIAGANNTGIAWDLSGCAQGLFESFTFIGGSSTSNCPKVALFQGAMDLPGFVYAGNYTFRDVEIESYGDHIIYNAGCEEIDYINCLAIGWRDATFASAQPFVFVASGCTPGVTSALATTFSPVRSMTCVHWYGGNASIVLSGLFGIVFHFNGTGARASANIWFDAYFACSTAIGSPFKFMVDDASGGTVAGTALYNCGMRDVQAEQFSNNPDFVIGSFSVAVAQNLEFSGFTGANTVSKSVVVFSANTVPTNVRVNWAPNVAGPWTGGFVVLCQGIENGVYVTAPVPWTQLCQAASDRSFGGLHAINISGQGIDYDVRGNSMLHGSEANAQFNLLETSKVGNQVSVLSLGYRGVQTTQSVAVTAAPICQLPSLHQLVMVDGVGAAGAKFGDLLWCDLVSAPTVVSSKSEGGAAARTYTTVSNAINLSIAAGTFNITAMLTSLGGQV